MAGVTSTSRTPGGNVVHVNPLIGTDGPDPTEYGGMVPSAAPPFAMTRWTPMTRENGISRCAYHYADPSIIGFLGSHQPAIWMGDWGHVAVMPGVGRVRPLAADRGLPFTHADEVAGAAGYRVRMTLPSSDGQSGGHVDAHLTGTSRVGFCSFTFAPDGDASPWVLVQATRVGFVGSVAVDPGRREISGFNPERQDAHLGPPAAAGFRGYFVARFDEPFASVGTALGGVLADGSLATSGEELSAYVRFATGTSSVGLRVGVSLISIEQARANLDREIPDGTTAAEVEAATAAAWNEKLDRVQLTGATDDDLVTFYTSLFHALQYPSELDEDGRYYCGYTDSVRAATSGYTAFSLWDTFRAQNALLILLAPERIDGMVSSLLRSYEASGWLPIWENLVETNIMVGTHADSIVAEAMVKGFTGFSSSLAYEAVLKDATVPPERDTELRFADREEQVPAQARAGLTSYLANGWVAADRTAEAGSRTLDYAFDDACVARVAELTGHPDVARALWARSSNYRTQWNPETGFISARNSDGSWAEDGWTEGTKWPYLFGALHDIRGLRDLMGVELFRARLDEHFAGGWNMHDNEPSHHIPYLYSYAGQPWKTQAQVRSIARASYLTDPGGLCGNDDLGQMSAWYLFTAMGFYPVDPSSGEYVVGAPLFDSLVIDLPWADGPLEVLGPGAPGAPYVAALTVNGVPRNEPFLRHADIAHGGRIEFSMSTEPTTWGASAD
jgi:predicted alpha-1,2-mannosidase